MMRLEATWFVAAFHSTPMHDPGPEEFQRLCFGYIQRLFGYIQRPDGEKLETAWAKAECAEMASIRGGSPTALDLKMVSSVFSFSNRSMFNTSGRSLAQGIL